MQVFAPGTQMSHWPLVSSQSSALMQVSLCGLPSPSHQDRTLPVHLNAVAPLPHEPPLGLAPAAPPELEAPAVPPWLSVPPEFTLEPPVPSLEPPTLAPPRLVPEPPDSALEPPVPNWPPIE